MEDNNIPEQPQLFPEPKKKKSSVFPIILGIILIVGGFFGYRAYSFSQTHEETDDAQIASNMSPVTVSYTHLDVYKRQV